MSLTDPVGCSRCSTINLTLSKMHHPPAIMCGGHIKNSMRQTQLEANSPEELMPGKKCSILCDRHCEVAISHGLITFFATTDVVASRPTNPGYCVNVAPTPVVRSQRRYMLPMGTEMSKSHGTPLVEHFVTLTNS